ncbi:hypothetical protein A9Q77_09190 [Marinomonas sp. 42_23_T18]|nr:hypothetical protein A9Q77_09190 [Marinomonas sp. 42_23_T18]
MQFGVHTKSHIINQVTLVRLIQLCVVLIAIGTPVIESHFIHPAFIKLIVQNTESEAIRTAHRLQRIVLEDYQGGKLLVSNRTIEQLKEAEVDYGLWKSKIFSHDGEVLYSSHEKDIGSLNRHSYFHNQVASGNNFTKLVQKDNMTLEGQRVELDVVETYIPMMVGDNFIGAFELYYDISQRREAIDAHMEWVDKMLLLLSSIAIFTAFVIGIGYKKVQKIREEYELELIEMATKDKLTNLYNRRSFESRLMQDIQDYQEFQTELSVIIFDVDHFKFVNDTYGHQAGDCVLTLLADVAKKSIRKNDIIARYGGEEFIILLPNTGKNGAKVIAEELRNAVQNTAYDASTYKILVTISLGVACICDVKSPNLDKLIKHADDALYRAKHNGRNQVCYMQTQTKEKSTKQANVSLRTNPLLDS